MSGMDDDEWGGGFDDLPEAFDVDVATVDAQDTVDISAQFFRVCARIYPDNPLHTPVYNWISSLPRTGNGNIKSISDHLVVALRLYVDTLNSGASLQLSSTLVGSIPFAGPAGCDRRQPLEQKLNSSDEQLAALSSERYSASVSPSRRYQQSRQLRDGLQYGDAPASERCTSAPQSSPSTVGGFGSRGAASSIVVSQVTSDNPPLKQSGPTHAADLSEPAVVPPTLSSDRHIPSSPSSTQVSSIPKPPASDTDGLSFVAKLARDSDGWT